MFLESGTAPTSFLDFYNLNILFKTSYFEIIVDSRAVVRNNTETSLYTSPGFPQY